MVAKCYLRMKVICTPLIVFYSVVFSNKVNMFSDVWIKISSMQIITFSKKCYGVLTNNDMP